MKRGENFQTAYSRWWNAPKLGGSWACNRVDAGRPMYYVLRLAFLAGWNARAKRDAVNGEGSHGA